MIENAVKKLTDEMEKNQNHAYIQYVGKYLTEYITQHPEAAEKIMNQDKTIAGSLAEVKKEARKKKTGNVAVLSDQEGFDAVLNYFEVTATSPAAPAPATPTKRRFDVSLEDLL